MAITASSTLPICRPSLAQHHKQPRIINRNCISCILIIHRNSRQQKIVQMCLKKRVPILDRCNGDVQGLALFDRGVQHRSQTPAKCIVAIMKFTTSAYNPQVQRSSNFALPASAVASLASKNKHCICRSLVSIALIIALSNTNW